MPLSTSRVPDTDSTAALYRQRSQARIVTAFLALASVIMLSVGMTMGQGQAKADVWDALAGLEDLKGLNPASGLGNVVGVIINNDGSQTLLEQWRIDACASGAVSGGADCSGSTGTGVALVMPGELELAPVVLYQGTQAFYNNVVLQTILGWFGAGGTLKDAPLPEGSATVIGDGFQFAMASTGGKATAISYLPVSLATAGASDGRTAFAFALVGLANAWTTSDIPVTVLSVDTGIDIPGIQSVGCYGGLTAAYAQEVGACANVLGTFDFRFDQLQNIPQVQFGLTDPSSVLFDTTDVLGKVITDIFAGKTPTLSKDFVRLSIGGDSLLALTSGYGLSAPVTIDWLGSQITLYSTANINGEDRPNFFALPVIEFGTFDTTQIIPTISIPQIDFPFGLESAGPYDTASTTVAARALTVVDPTADAVSVTPESIGTAARVGSDDSDDAESDSDPTTSSATETTTTSETGTSEADATATETTETGTTGTGTTGTGAADASPKTTGASGAGDTTSSGGADTAADDDDSSDADTPAVTSAE